jgi:hypothetical protein
VIAISYKIKGTNTHSVFYLKDYHWDAARKSLRELQEIHGANNVSLDFVSDFCFSEEEFWSKNWNHL